MSMETETLILSGIGPFRIGGSDVSAVEKNRSCYSVQEPDTSLQGHRSHASTGLKFTEQ